MKRIVLIMLLGLFLYCNCKSWNTPPEADRHTSHTGGKVMSPELGEFPGFNPVFAKEQEGWIESFNWAFAPIREEREWVPKGPKGVKTKTEKYNSVSVYFRGFPEYRGAKYEEKKGVSAIYKYDERGNEIEAVWYLPPDFTSERENRLCKYDDRDNLIEMARYKTITHIYLYKYDDKDNLIERVQYDDDGYFHSFHSKVLYKYDDRGKKIEWACYDANDKLSSKGLYKYDDRGKLIERPSYDADGKLTGHGEIFKYECDDKGRLKSVLYEDDKFFFKYDDKDRLIESARYDYRNDKLQRRDKHIYKYYADTDYHIETAFYERDYDDNKLKFTGKYLYRYDDRGNLMGCNKYDADDDLVETADYRYDNRDNRIEEIRYKVEGFGIRIGEQAIHPSLREQVPSTGWECPDVTLSRTVWEYEYYPEQK